MDMAAPTRLKAQPFNIADTLSADPRFVTFARLLRAGGVETMLRSGGSFTIFAPRNEAFDVLGVEPKAIVLYEQFKTTPIAGQMHP